MEHRPCDFMSWFKVLAAAIFLFWGLHNIEVLWSGVLLFLRVLAPFIMGFSIAFILNIPMKFNEYLLFKKLKIPMHSSLKRPIALLLTVIIFAGILAIVMVSVIPELSATLKLLRNNLPQYFEKTQDWLEEILASWQFQDAVAWVEALEFDWNRIFNTITDMVQSSLGGIFNSTVSMVSSIFSGVITFILSMVFAVYMLMEKEVLRKQLTKVLYAYATPQHSQTTLEILALTQKTFSSFIAGQVLEALILGILFLITMLIFRFPYALVISLFIGFASIIPVFGAFVGLFIGFFLILLVNPIQAFWFNLLFLTIQQIEGNIIYPKVMSTRIGLPSIWVLLAVTLGGSLLGVWGILLFIPIASVFYTLLRREVHRKLDEKELEIPVITQPPIVDQALLSGSLSPRVEEDPPHEV
jgi:predicted PurR-regulated permease PerM